MKYIVTVLLALAAAPAVADPAPRAPDFSDNLPSHGVDRSTATSPADNRIEPSDDLVYATDSDTLDSDAEATLDQAAHWLIAHPREHLVVVAHADRAGTDAYNDDLAMRRGHHVRDYLESAGVATDRVAVVDCGKHGAASRRVELYASADPAQDTAARCK
nr:OmpA family protein [Kofleriaceae bacterium]